jgi:hypothetical protein
MARGARSRFSERVSRTRAPKKENPAVGTPGQTFVVIGVYGFKYAAWLLAQAPGGADLIYFSISAIVLCSSSSIFLLLCNVLNLTEPFAVAHSFLFFRSVTRPLLGTTS